MTMFGVSLRAIGSDLDFSKYFQKFTLAVRREKFLKIWPDTRRSVTTHPNAVHVPAHPKSTRHDEGAWWQLSVVAEREHETQDWLRGTCK